jgi:hypothetical protein
MSTQTQYLNHGNLDVAFVFSAPGTKESINGRPVAGATGENLEFALAHLCQKQPNYFTSLNRYDYRITNAFQSALSIGLGSGRSEASSAEILKPANVRRVVDELEGCRLVILCGNKAQLLQATLRHSEFRVVCVTHTSNQALSSKHNTSLAKRDASPTDRRRLRAEAWAFSLHYAIDALQGVSRCAVSASWI